MDHKHLNVHDLQSIQTPTTIKTSKNWVLPPRPRPGRKPNAKDQQTSSQSQSQSSSTVSSPSSQQCSLTNIEPIKPKKTYKKKSNNQVNPLELALKQIQNENKSLKLELSKLVSDLKFLQNEERNNDYNSIHKKRHHVEIDDDMDDMSSTISTPSLVSSTSSISSSLTSIKEEQSNNGLKLDDFLTLSYFDDVSNQSFDENTNIIENDLNSILTNKKPNMISNGLKFNNVNFSSYDRKPLKSNNNDVMLSPPSLPIDLSQNEFEFSFLKQETDNKSTDPNSLFELMNTDREIFDW